MKRPTKLVDLVLDEISIVDKAASRHSAVVILKRDDTAPAIAPLHITKGMMSADMTSQPTQSEESAMDTVAKAERALDAVVKRYANQHQHMSEPEVHARLSRSSPEYRAAYREAVLAKDIAIAKETTLACGADRITKVGGHEVGERTAVTDALEKLDAMAKQAASKTGETYFQSYARILTSQEGKALYSIACNKPSLGAAAA